MSNFHVAFDRGASDCVFWAPLTRALLSGNCY